MKPLPALTVSYEDMELISLRSLADWAWAGVGGPAWSSDHHKTLEQAIVYVAGPFHKAAEDAVARLSAAGAGEFTLGRIRRVEAAGMIGIRDAVNQVIATNGDPLLLRATLERIAVKRYAGPMVQGQGRWAAFGYLETAVGTGLTRQRSLALRGRRIFTQ